MSRRRGEFEHRTSIFEGAFRAWSHLGGLRPEDLESKPAADLDPLTTPVDNDPRRSSHKARNPDGTLRREYPYEPLPRSGLSHPYVQAILSPWLGPDADNEAIQLGLTTLRTWWQHRRKGESGSATAALGTEKMKGVVEGYTRHFFTLAHCLVVNDNEQPPRTLHGKMKELDKLRSKRLKKRASLGDRDDMSNGAAGILPPTVGGTLPDSISAALTADLTDANLTPLERLHAAQRRQLAESNFQHQHDPLHGTAGTAAAGTPKGIYPIINIKGKCIPGKLDLHGVVDAITRSATQLAHRGGFPGGVDSSSGMAGSAADHAQDYGDPNTTPVVFVSGSTGDIQIAMTIEGITCAHCVKIVETVLIGCGGNKSPIDGLLDAAADRALASVIIKVDRASNAKRIAFEAARNLAMVGYTAKAKEMTIIGAGADKKATMDLGSLSTAFEVVAATDAKDVFDWSLPCSCPDNGVLRQDCLRHSQMNTRIFDAFEAREQQVQSYMAGCGMPYGMDCTCGPDCRCTNCPMHSNQPQNRQGYNEQQHSQPTSLDGSSSPTNMQPDDIFEVPLHMDQRMDFFGMEPAMDGSPMDPSAVIPSVASVPLAGTAPVITASTLHTVSNEHSRAQRNPSVISYGNGLRHMSLTSETTFGRAMSGLSALSIDWENLEDFDVEVDHSAHINNNSNSPGGGSGGGGKMQGYAANDHFHHGGPRQRLSMRRSMLAQHANAAAAASAASAVGGETNDHRVSFKE